MALLEVSGYKPELRGQLLGTGGHRHLIDRSNHYSFGSKTPEFAVPLGVDVSIISSGKLGISILKYTR